MGFFILSTSPKDEADIEIICSDLLLPPLVNLEIFFEPSMFLASSQTPREGDVMLPMIMVSTCFYLQVYYIYTVYCIYTHIYVIYL